MAEEIAVGDRLTGTLARLRGLAGDGPIGTGHLLFAVAHDKDVAPLLDAFDISPLVVHAVLKDVPAERRDGSPGEQATVRDADGRTLPVTAAAAAALRKAGQDSRVALLTALLDDDGSEAYAVLRDCGADVGEVRRAVGAGRAPGRADRLAPELRPARDALIGRVRYRGRGLRDRLLFSVLARGANHATRPVLWARLEADERARAQGRATGTDDVLLALLVTHEVAAAYPHLARNPQGGYGGGAALLARGVDHHRVRAAIRDLGPGDVPPGRILVPGPDWTEDTAVLLERLLAHPASKAARLVAALGGPS